MNQARSRPALGRLRITDPPKRWRDLGFTVSGEELQLGTVTIELGSSAADLWAIVAWGLRGLEPVPSIDGLPTEPAGPPGEASEHPNGACSIDHVVVSTPDFDRSAAALASAGLELRAVREGRGGSRQGFRRLGETILELVETPGAQDRSAPARFWGLVVVVSDLDALARRLGEQLGPVKPAVQPGRRIATLRQAAGVGPALAFMTPEPG